jgi:hypothetical protein
MIEFNREAKKLDSTTKFQAVSNSVIFVCVTSADWRVGIKRTEANTLLFRKAQAFDRPSAAVAAIIYVSCSPISFRLLKHLQKPHSANLPASVQKETKSHYPSKHDFYLLLKLARENDSYHTFLLNNPFNFWKFSAITRVHIPRLGGGGGGGRGGRSANCISDSVTLCVPIFYVKAFQNYLQSIY